MATIAAYDRIADWYEEVVLGAPGRDEIPDDDALGIHRALRELLGPGRGTCLEIGCGTGQHAAGMRRLGWTPVGVDISAGMLRHAAGRLPTARADAERLPLSDSSVPAAISMMVHTDMPGYPAILREAFRVLRPGGVFVHVGVHPCFCGGFADRTDARAIVISPGYRDSHWTKESWNSEGIRAKVGATHLPLPTLLHAFLDAGLTIDSVTEGGEPTPMVLALRARKPR